MTATRVSLSTDAFTLFEYMLREASDVEGVPLYEGTIEAACAATGLRNHDKARAALTRELKSQGLGAHKQRLGWFLYPKIAKAIEVEGVGNMAELLEPKEEIILDLTPPVDNPQPPQTIEPADAFATLSGMELASAIAKELFDRLEQGNCTHDDEINDLKVENISLGQRLHDLQSLTQRVETQLEEATRQVAAAREDKKNAEKQMLEQKVKTEKLEMQIAQMMKEMAASAGDDLADIAKRFLRQSTNGGRRAPIPSALTDRGSRPTPGGSAVPVPPDTPTSGATS